MIDYFIFAVCVILGGYIGYEMGAKDAIRHMNNQRIREEQQKQWMRMFRRKDDDDESDEER